VSRRARFPGFALLFVVFVAMLAGCGFHLRGTDLRSSVARAYVDAVPRHTYGEPLKLALERAGAEVIDAPAAGSLVVELLDERRDRRSISVSDSAVAAEYEVIIGVRYGVRDGTGARLIEPQWLERSRVYRADRDNILGSSEERALLEREMQQELVQQIIRTLDALASARDVNADGGTSADGT
jgi:LPS-assembly lipoprotein